MTQTAGLRRNIEALPDIVEQGDDPHIVLHAIGRRIDADHRVADAEQKSVEQAGRNSAGIVGRMVRLQPRPKRSPLRLSTTCAMLANSMICPPPTAWRSLPSSTAWSII